MDERRKAAWIGGSIIVKGDVVVDRGSGHRRPGPRHHRARRSQPDDRPRAHPSIADLVAKAVIISGTVKGNVIGNAKVELKSTAKVEGDITAPKFVMEDGADAGREGRYGSEEGLASSTRACGARDQGPWPLDSATSSEPASAAGRRRRRSAGTARHRDRCARRESLPVSAADP